MIKNIFFDLDGTLISSIADITFALNTMLKKYDLPQTNITTVTSIIGKGYPITVRKVLALFIKDDNKIEEIIDEAIEIVITEYKKLNGTNTTVFDGVYKTLEILKEKNIKMAVVTNKDEASARDVLKKLSLDGYFEAVIGGDTTFTYKPAPEPLYYAMYKLDANIENSLMVGDSINDYLCAKETGMKAILVSHGYDNGVDLKSLNAFGYIDSFKELINFLD